MDINKELLLDLSDVILAVASRLETTENFLKIKNHLNLLLNEKKIGDLQLLVEDLFEKVEISYFLIIINFYRVLMKIQKLLVYLKQCSYFNFYK